MDFSPNPIMRRYNFLDIAKAISILGMVYTHILEEFLRYVSPSFQASWFSFFNHIRSIFIGATGFMLIMGLSVHCSRKNSVRGFLKKGLNLMIWGLLLNIARNLAYAICIGITRPASLILLFMDENIFFFAGLTMWAFALLVKLKTKPWQFPVIAIVISLIGTVITPYLPHFSRLGTWIYFTSGHIDAIVGTHFDVLKAAFTELFYDSCGYDGFPFFTWFFYPACGYFLGYYMVRCEDINSLMKKSFLVALPCLIIAIFLNSSFHLGNIVFNFTKYEELGFSGICATAHSQNFFDSILILLGAVTFFCVLHFVFSKAQTFNAVCSHIAKQLTHIYVAQWIIISNLDTIFMKSDRFIYFSGSDVFLLYITIFVASYLVSILYTRLKKNLQNIR